jgi:hypothetical protein
VAGIGQRDRNMEVLHEIFTQTDTRWAPWQVIDGNDETSGSIAALTAIAELMEKAMPAEPPAVGETVIQFRHPKAGENGRA